MNMLSVVCLSKIDHVEYENDLDSQYSDGLIEEDVYDCHAVVITCLKNLSEYLPEGTCNEELVFDPVDFFNEVTQDQIDLVKAGVEEFAGVHNGVEHELRVLAIALQSLYDGTPIPDEEDGS